MHFVTDSQAIYILSMSNSSKFQKQPRKFSLKISFENQTEYLILMHLSPCNQSKQGGSKFKLEKNPLAHVNGVNISLLCLSVSNRL
jgi:hypothetical protein